MLSNGRLPLIDATWPGFRGLLEFSGAPEAPGSRITKFSQSAPT
jgi:hypothetical protein